MEQKEINIKLYNDSNIFSGDNKIKINKYIDDIDIIYNRKEKLKLNYEIIKFDNNINYNNYDFSDRFININVIIYLLEFFYLKTLNTYNIYEFFKKNKMKYNIWSYLYSSEYISYDIKPIYDKFAILRLCLSYSWKECLYDLLKRCLDVNRCYKTFIWIDIFCVNQFNEKIKQKGLNKIEDIYHIADVYNISSFDAFKRYWCCYEMSLKKKSIDGTIINYNDDIDPKIENILNNLFDNVFNNTELLYNGNYKKIYI